ncbi:hypothetical protein F0562_017361 [Nyssa sinensis]|uniref:Uncharacterized protein n=1 Tax=Nyssa sinensis TaxID=561372 RepID=A0A5J4ZHQ1_9ASTE|nr:hypothetical protein F0562_017361 [Nyssa sinensis]
MLAFSRSLKQNIKSFLGMFKQGSREAQKEPAGVLYEDELWRPCLKGIHPAWLLAFHLFAFFVLLILLLLNGAVDDGSIFYFHTQSNSTSSSGSAFQSGHGHIISAEDNPRFEDGGMIIGRYADLKNNRLTNYTFNFNQMLNDQVAVVIVAFPATLPLLARARIYISASHSKEDLIKGLELPLHPIQIALFKLLIRYSRSLEG